MLPGLLAAAGLGLDGLVRAATHRHARNLATGLAVLMLGLALAFVPRPPPMPWTTTEFAELVAEAAWRQGRTETAVEWLGAGLTLEPRKPTLNHLMGRVLSDAELPARALPFYRTAVEQRPRDVPTRVGLARVLVMLGQKENARQELLAASLLNPDSPDVAYCLAVLEDDAGRSEQALALYRRALHFNPGFVRAHLKHANLCARRGLPDEARQHFLAALRLAPGNKAAMDGLARLSRIAVVSPAGAPAPAAPPHR
jgi:tetratricopeptide (TPR) repeat protein